MDAILLVGGRGTRLRPLTIGTPKPMLPAAGVPFITHQLVHARNAGIDHVVLATSYRAEVFADHFGTGAELGLQIDYVTETVPLGTGGGIRNVVEMLHADLDDPVVILNGDVLSGHDLAGQIAAHTAAKAAVTLHLVEVADPRAFGCVPTDADGRVTAFLEKHPNPVTNRINAGCYVFTRSVIDAIPAGRPVSVERETFPGVLAAGALVLGFVDTSYWLDLGTPADYVRGSCDLVLGLAPGAVPAPGESMVLPGASVSGAARLSGGTCVGSGATVGAATIHGSVLFDRARIADGATVRDSVVGHDAVVGAGTVLDGAVVGDGAQIGSGCELFAGARVWPGAVIADGALRFSSDES